MKREKYTERADIPLTPSQKTEIGLAARNDDETIANYMRRAALDKARAGK